MEIDLKEYKNIVLAEKHKSLVNERYTLKSMNGKEIINRRIQYMADLILIHENGVFTIFKNRYGPQTGEVELPDDQLALLYLTT